MYAYIAKGFTVGHTLTRRLFRNMTAMPGLVLDAVFVAPFWCPHYETYWQQALFLYPDGTEARGFLRWIFGCVGDITGALLGSFIGAIIGLSIFAPNRLGLGIRWVCLNLFHEIDDFAKAIARHSYLDGFVYNNPDNYRQKAWNVSAGTLGLMIGSPLYGIAKTIEFFLPIGNKLSHFLWGTGLVLGGIAGSIISIPAYPVYKFTSSVIRLYDTCRDIIRKGVAFIYLKTNQTLYQPDPECCLMPQEAVHSDKFRDQFNGLKGISTTAFLLGPEKEPLEMKATAPPAQTVDELICPISQQAFKKPVIDKQGHTFENESIRKWIQQNGGTCRCPVGTENLTLQDLVPNRALESAMKKIS